MLSMGLRALSLWTLLSVAVLASRSCAQTCPQSPCPSFAPCCSKYGYCGSTDAYCGANCVAGCPGTSTSKTSNYVMLNCINWQSLSVLPPEATEYTYFVLEISSGGDILVQSSAQEDAFVKKVHGMGKKATFSIAGGTQNVADIENAVSKHRAALLNNIAAHIRKHGYDGVVVDIEGTNIQAATMTAFIRALRLKLDTIRPKLILGIYVQPYQINTVWATIGNVKNSITWMSAMIYDYPNTVAQLKSDTLKWAAKLPKSKLLVGVAVNYDATGLNLTEFPVVLRWLKSQGFKGVGIWQNKLYISSYRQLVKTILKP